MNNITYLTLTGELEISFGIVWEKSYCAMNHNSDATWEIKYLKLQDT